MILSDVSEAKASLGLRGSVYYYDYLVDLTLKTNEKEKCGVVWLFFSLWLRPPLSF